jgi:hypothetical protein
MNATAWANYSSNVSSGASSSHFGVYGNTVTYSNLTTVNIVGTFHDSDSNGTVGNEITNTTTTGTSIRKGGADQYVVLKMASVTNTQIVLQANNVGDHSKVTLVNANYGSTQTLALFKIEDPVDSEVGTTFTLSATIRNTVTFNNNNNASSDQEQHLLLQQLNQVNMVQHKV